MTAPGAEAAPVLHAEAAAEAVRGIAPAQRAAIDNYLNGVFSKSQSIVDVANQMKSAEAHKLSGEALAYFEANIQNHMEGEFSHASFSEQSQTVDGLAKLVKKTSNHALKNWYEAMLNDTENTPLFRARVEYLQTEILDKIKVTDKVGMTLQDYDAIKHMKVGKLLGHHFLHSAKNFLKSSSSVIDFGQPQVYGTGYGGGMFYRGFMGGRMGIGGSLYGGWGGPYGYGIGPRVEDVQNYKEGIFEAALRETVKRTGMPWSVAKECAVGEVVGDVVDKNVPMPTM